jgi:pilus assembly protein CpaD
MAHPLRTIRSAATLALALALSATPALARPSEPNRSFDTVHVPVISRTDYVFDALTGPAGLVPGEAARLSGWFDGLGLGYGDTITLDTSGSWHDGPAADAIAHVAADYGMLLANEGAPVTVGHPPAGSVRVVVSRSTAMVPNCPDFGIGNTPTHNNTTTSNFGCASMSNLAAMVANPQDLVSSSRGYRGADAAVSIKAIKAYREAATTGANNQLKTVSSTAPTSSGGN